MPFCQRNWMYQQGFQKLKQKRPCNNSALNAWMLLPAGPKCVCIIVGGGGRKRC